MAYIRQTKYWHTVLKKDKNKKGFGHFGSLVMSGEQQRLFLVLDFSVDIFIFFQFVPEAAAASGARASCFQVSGTGAAAAQKLCKSKNFAHGKTDAPGRIARIIMFLLLQTSHSHPASSDKACAGIKRSAQKPTVYSITPALSRTKRAKSTAILLLLLKKLLGQSEARLAEMGRQLCYP